ncbi:MAG: glycosyltransferase family 39 protein [Planctomycetes bacterium]|nr:glycosyltransferase family 39 protein [Planctomycetota bacterium]
MSANQAAVGNVWTNLRRIAVLLAFALICRAGALWKFRDHLRQDPDNYRRIAEQLVAGGGYSDPDSSQPTAYRPPLYPCLLAGILAAGGTFSTIGIVQAGLGLLTVGLTIDVGRRLGLGKARLAAGLFAAVDPILLHQTAQVMTETLATSLATLWLWLLLGPDSKRWRLLSGIVFGLACLCRPTFWVAGALCGLAALVRRRPDSKPSTATTMNQLAPALASLLGVVLAVTPWVVRNTFVMGQPILTTTHGGYTLILPHNPEYTKAVVHNDWGAAWQGLSFENWASSLEEELARLDPPLDHTHHSPQAEVARDRWLNRQAWAYIQADKATAFKTAATLLGRMWSVKPARTAGDDRETAIRWAVAAFYVPLFAAALIGLWRIRGTGWRNWKYPLLLVVGYTAVHALYWADMRMRAPLMPVVALLAAASLSEKRPRPAADQVSAPSPRGKTGR